ncbi:ATP-binding cassette domain-containing protein, partial [Paramaledivibacter caminithermalis]
GLLENPDTGTINVCGATDVKANSRQAQHLLRTKIGFLFQNFALIDDKSVSYNLDIACINSKIPRSKWNDKKTKLLKDLQLNISLKEKVYNLSGGEQQRLALARILLKNCDLIFADEPTGSLDISNRDIILDILSQLNRKGKTIVLVSHDSYIVNNSRRVVEL